MKRTLSSIILCFAYLVFGADSVHAELRSVWQPISLIYDDPDVEGIWQSKAKGHLLEVADGGLRVFHHMDGFCIDDNGSVPDYRLFYYDSSSDRLTLSHYDYRQDVDLLTLSTEFERLDALPDGCGETTVDSQASFLELFDLVWTNFDHYYAFFDQRGVDWLEQKNKYRPLVEQADSNEAFFGLLKAMLSPFNDGHVNVSFDGDYYNAGNPKLRQRLTQAWQASDKSLTEGQFVANWRQSNLDSIALIMDDKQFNTAADGAIEWGTINKKTGYIRINSFRGFDKSAPSRKDEVQSLKQSLAEIMSHLDEVEKFIIDVTHNGGGYDESAMVIVQQFMDKPRKVLRLRVKDGQEQMVFLTPSSQPETRPVFVVTSEVSVSAAESFTLMMRALPHVTHVGETTRGSLSGLLPKPLPNGLAITISYQHVLDSDGRLFEGAGIPPQHYLPLYTDGDLFTGYAKSIQALAL